MASPFPFEIPINKRYFYHRCKTPGLSIFLKLIYLCIYPSIYISIYLSFYLSIYIPSSVYLVGCNCLVVGAVARKAEMRTPRNIFIFNLALADLCLAAAIPFTAVDSLHRNIDINQSINLLIKHYYHNRWLFSHGYTLYCRRSPWLWPSINYNTTTFNSVPWLSYHTFI